MYGLGVSFGCLGVGDVAKEKVGLREPLLKFGGGMCKVRAFF